jgi:GT2 family glycosyltransferase
MIGIIVIIYSLYPEKLIRSVDAYTRSHIKWYFFYHSKDRILLARVQSLARLTNGSVFCYRTNRGVAKSWNDGLLLSLREGNDITMLINDDTFFYPGCFDDFVDFIRKERAHTPDYGLCTPRGFEAEGAYKGAMDHMHLACCAIGPAAIERVGYFDENFQPAYWEDTDYLRRMHVLGLPILYDNRILIEHERGQTMRSDPLVRKKIEVAGRENCKYWHRKWGGWPHQERFEHPFNNSAFDCFISAERRRTPYGPQFDRADNGEFPPAQ